MSLAVRGATLGGEVVGLRTENGLIAELGPEVAPRKGTRFSTAAGPRSCRGSSTAIPTPR